MFRARAYLKDGRFEPNVPREQLPEILKDVHNQVWIDIEDIRPNDVGFLHEEMKIHPVAIEEVLFPSEHPELQAFENHLLLVLHAPSPNLAKGGMDTIEIDFLVGRNFIITVRSGSVASIKDLEDRIEANPKIMARGCDYMLYFMADAMVDDYLPILDAIDKRLNATQDVAVKNPTRDTFSDMMKLKSDILEIRRATVPQLEVLRSLTRGHAEIIEQPLLVYFRSVCEHLQQVNAHLDTYREEVNSIIQVCLAVKSDQLNEVMRVLTVIAVIMMPLTLITGVFGMNFEMPEWLSDRVNWIFISAVMAGLGLSLIFYFRRKNWL